ncbi:LCP family protein [Cryobacterium sp. SO2]|uniref:LCP family protein n=1 Tax=Cryobacterium sp. SO2 TaxID=1897060 RepID=UPI00223D7873|nr:LCP family protein [Cryobacterium sp. SO2]WEO77385.1 LCP family protein [Cryobacterium sp. SO2]
MSEESDRAGIARHGRLKRPNPVTGVLVVVAMALAVLLVSGASVAALAVWQLTTEVSANSIDLNGADEADAPINIGSYEDGFNILIVGVDNDAAQGAAYGVRETALNDVNILVHVSADHSNAVVVSIPRDLIVEHPECTNADTGEVFEAMSAAPINEAMSRGGLPCVVNTVSGLTGLDIPFAGVVSFSGVVQMSDAVGGVPICLSAPIDDPDAGLNLPEGTNVVSGENALAFLRSRHGVGDGSDLSRISSQQLYLASLMRTVQSNGTLTDVPKLLSLANAAAKNIKLSTNLAHADTMVSMALALKDIDLSRLVFVQYPGTTDDPDFPGKVVPTQDLADTMFGKIAADEPFSLTPAEPTEPTEEPEAPVVADPPVDVPADPSATDAPAATPTPTPEALDGLTGITGTDESCAQASGN